MNEPKITPGFGLLLYEWADNGLSILIDRYDDKGKAEITLYLNNRTLHRASVNLLATTTMSSLAKKMESYSTEIPWNDIFTYITVKTIDTARKGHPVEEIWPEKEDTLEAEYLIEPVLYLNHPSVLFGEYSSLKSFTSMLLAYIASSEYYEDGSLHFHMKKEPGTVLVLDYEDDKGSFRKRWSAINNGFGTPPIKLHYRRMTGALYDDVEFIKRYCDKNKVVLVVVDSLGPAARGNLNDPEAAIKYHSALREIGVTSLTLAHTSKDRDSNHKTIFGSVFFTNLARAVWECKAEQEVGSPEAYVSVKNAKANLSQRHHTIGLKYSFSHDTVSICKADLSGTGLSSSLPLRKQVEIMLSREGPMTAKQLLKELDTTEGSIRATCNRMRNEGVVRKDGEKWVLLEI